jgi:hypothetical protein
MPTPPVYTSAFKRIGSETNYSSWGFFRTAVIAVGYQFPMTYSHSQVYLSSLHPTIDYVHENLYRSAAPNTSQGNLDPNGTGLFGVGYYSGFPPPFDFNALCQIDNDERQASITGGTVTTSGGTFIMTDDASNAVGQSVGGSGSIISIVPL